MGDIDLSPVKQIDLGQENPVTNDDIARVKLKRAFRVEEIVATKFGGSGTFDFEVRFSPNADDQGAGTLIHSDTGVNNTTTGVVYNPPGDFAAVTIPANNWVWLELTLVSTGISRPVAVSLTIYGTELTG